MPDDVVAINARHWDALADVHHAGTGAFYDLEALRRGADPLWDCERAALARVAPDGVAGLDVLHHQCHLGADAIHFAREGARVTGLDVSPNTLRLAAQRAETCGVTGIRWVRADAAAPPAALSGAFDLVWATIGITSWAPDLRAWMRAAGGMLKPGGTLVLIDVHPLYAMLESADPVAFDFPYGGGSVHVFDADGSYDDPDAEVAETRSANVAWSVGEHVRAAIDAGLLVEHLQEHLHSEHDPRGRLEREADGAFRLRLAPDAPPVPLLFTLVARSQLV